MAANEAKTAREEWGTRFGFLMAMVGGMVGAGNIWRFPYVMGDNGGGAFVLAFLVLLFLLAVPGLMAEVALGRYTNKGVIGAFRDVLGPGGMVGLGVVVLLVNIALMSYYAPLIGWTLYYAVHSLLFTFTSSGFEAEPFMNAFFANPALMIGLHTLVMASVAGILMLGIRRGVERIVVVAVPALVASLAVMTAYGLTLDGAADGLAFAFSIDWAYLTYSSTWIEALGQALFSTGLGWGIALTVGSYLREYDDVPLGGGVFTAIGESSVGILAALAIFPVVFSVGVEPDAGAGLAFVSLVQVFPEIPFGALVAILFFLGFFIATFTSGLLITEVSVTTVSEETRFNRTQTVLGVCGAIWLLGLPSAYSTEFLGFADFLFGSWGLPLATLSIILVIGWVMGPKRLRVLAVNRNAGIHISSWWDPVIKYVIPAVMLFIMSYYAVDEFGSPEMIGGMLVIVLFPLIGYGIMSVADRSAVEEETAEVPGGDD
ncbi:sodium- and chloride-dependent transporter [Halostagnicola larsenii XH-48]|uniref:Transporter n=1 Tax=Halostagnicola larsenii XH-48 TaxID=797299 RepID=W0JSV0_9EURY|nr:sodium-dependent transporter [Halostagnicola larsenii]AHG00367.1 sodium- and chloride-dependent transporter [Halostagnicola larsenii XH-48]